MDIFKWVVLALILICGAAAIRTIRRINRERAAAIERIEAQRSEAIRTRKVYEMPFQNLAARRDFRVVPKPPPKPVVDWEEF